MRILRMLCTGVVGALALATYGDDALARNDATVRQQTSRHQPAQRGEASYYGPGFHGRRMANGERFQPNANTAAHRTLPLGTTVRVTNLENGRSETVTVKDRGPYVRGRIIDVTPQVADELGMRQQGTAYVEVVPLTPPRSMVD